MKVLQAPVFWTFCKSMLKHELHEKGLRVDEG